MAVDVGIPGLAADAACGRDLPKASKAARAQRKLGNSIGNLYMIPTGRSKQRGEGGLLLPRCDGEVDLGEYGLRLSWYSLRHYQSALRGLFPCHRSTRLRGPPIMTTVRNSPRYTLQRLTFPLGELWTGST